MVEWTATWINKYRRCVRDYEAKPRTPRSDGSHRHHRDHDQANRPNLTVLNHTLSDPLLAGRLEILAQGLWYPAPGD